MQLHVGRRGVVRSIICAGAEAVLESFVVTKRLGVPYRTTVVKENQRGETKPTALGSQALWERGNRTPHPEEILLGNPPSSISRDYPAPDANYRAECRMRMVKHSRLSPVRGQG
jgi:hypothetical protein